MGSYTVADVILSTPPSSYYLSGLDATTIVRFVNSANDNNKLQGSISVISSSNDVDAGSASYVDGESYDYSNVGGNNATAGMRMCPNFANQNTSLMLLRFSLSGVFLTIVCLLGACSNLLAFGVLFSSKKFNQSVYIYMKCLSFNDFLKLSAYLIFSLYSLIFLPSTSPEIILSATNALVSIYRFWFALSVMCQGLSIWFMSLITLDRCFALSSNFRIREAVCRKRTAIFLSVTSFAVWFAFFIVNTFLYTVEPSCIYPGTKGQVLNFYHPTEFAIKSWLFRIIFTIVFKFVLPVLLTVGCISYSTVILIHTISATSNAKKQLAKAGAGHHHQQQQQVQMQTVRKKSKKQRLVDTDLQQERQLLRTNSGSSQAASQTTSVHGRNLSQRIQTAHALSWAIATSMIFCHLPASTLHLANELTKDDDNLRISNESWFLISNEIANVLLSSSSAINFLLFFFSGAKYRAEMNRVFQRFKGKICRKSVPAHMRCYNYEPPPGSLRQNSVRNSNNNNNNNNNGANEFEIVSKANNNDDEIEEAEIQRQKSADLKLKADAGVII